MWTTLIVSLPSELAHRSCKALRTGSSAAKASNSASRQRLVERVAPRNWVRLHIAYNNPYEATGPVNLVS
jgi:hypothetical protein